MNKFKKKAEKRRRRKRRKGELRNGKKRGKIYFFVN